MKYICDNCEKYPCDDTEIKLMKYCPVYSPKPKPQTNADRIRSMSDEELAEFITYRQGLRPHHEHFEGTKLLWLDWLKEEAESEE